jgi:hypothetical protein
MRRWGVGDEVEVRGLPKLYNLSGLDKEALQVCDE